MIKQRAVSILGSTGSIGCNTLRVVGAFGADFPVVALLGGRNVERLAGQSTRQNYPEPR